MIRHHHHPLLLVIASTALAALARAQPLTIDWQTIEPGNVMSNAQFELRAAIAQHDAAPTMAGSGFELSGGFLVGLRCITDVDDGTGTGLPDGGVTIDDLLFFLRIFEEGQPTADVDDGSGTNTPDGGVTIDDLLYFLQRFEAGC